MRVLNPNQGVIFTLARLLISAAVTVPVLLLPAPAQAHHCTKSGPPAVACKYVKKKYPSCWKARPKGHVAVARCQIRRGAAHYRQPASDMIRVAGCESTYRWWIGGHHQGMYQFLWSTWRSTPFARRSPYSAKWSSMATAWMWSQGRRGEWACQ